MIPTIKLDLKTRKYTVNGKERNHAEMIAYLMIIEEMSEQQANDYLEPIQDKAIADAMRDLLG